MRFLIPQNLPPVDGFFPVLTCPFEERTPLNPGCAQTMRYDSIMPIPERLNPIFANAVPANRRTENARDRLIVALDVPDAAAAMALVDRLNGTCRWCKVGLELFVAAGPSIVEKLTERSLSVFLDLKFHDIPNTVAGAVRSASSLGARMMTLHAGGGPAMLAAAQNVVAGLSDPPQLLAVTVLTSMDHAQLNAVGIGREPGMQVKRLAAMGRQAGLNGFVCSPEEVAELRSLTGPEGVLVIPGIRPAGAAAGDQKRIATPASAIRDGASYLVVGRPITQAPDPAAAAEAILNEIAEASDNPA
jgi:orotidine-5'-phosphate decarboxylase